MTLPASCRSDQTSRGLLLPNLTLGGAEQMALDALLLEQSWSRELTQPVLRFYHWIRPSLSLGRHQRQIPGSWLSLASTGQLDLIRRPSGGGSVLHAGGLTYALIWPNPPRQRREAYRQVNHWIRRGFARLGISLRAGDTPAQADEIDCFARSTAADLVDTDKTKRIGSAQFWQHGHLLQHGEIPLAPPPELWQAVFGTTPAGWTKTPPDGSAVAEALLSSFSEGLSMSEWTHRALSDEERRLMLQRAEGYRVDPSAL